MFINIPNRKRLSAEPKCLETQVIAFKSHLPRRLLYLIIHIQLKLVRQKQLFNTAEMQSSTQKNIFAASHL